MGAWGLRCRGSVRLGLRDVRSMCGSLLTLVMASCLPKEHTVWHQAAGSTQEPHSGKERSHWLTEWTAHFERAASLVHARWIELFFNCILPQWNVSKWPWISYSVQNYHAINCADRSVIFKIQINFEILCRKWKITCIKTQTRTMTQTLFTGDTISKRLTGVYNYCRVGGN